MTVSLKNITKDQISIAVLLLPAIILVGYFVYIGILWNILVSVSDWKGLRASYNIKGLDEYVKFFNDPVFMESLTNNIFIIVFFVPLTLGVGLTLAILMDQKIRNEGFFRTIFLLPFTLSFVITGILWRWMYDYNEGVINLLFQSIGLGFIKIAWIDDPNLVKISIVLALTWQFGGYIMLIFLAGIRSIPETQIHAAMLDGASGFYLYRKIVIPQVKASMTTAFVILMVFGLKSFDFIWILTQGGPGYSSEILPLTMYIQSFGITRFATGAAIATILFISSMIIVVPYLYRSYRKEE